MYGPTPLFLRLVPARTTVRCNGPHHRIAPVFRRAHWRRVATRDATERHPRRNEASLRKRYGVPPGNSTGCHPGIAWGATRSTAPGVTRDPTPGDTRVTPGTPPRVTPGTPPRVTPGTPPRVSHNAQRCAAQSATSHEPAYHPGHYGLLTRVSLGAPRVVTRNATGRWLECWRAARALGLG